MIDVNIIKSYGQSSGWWWWWWWWWWFFWFHPYLAGPIFDSKKPNKPQGSWFQWLHLYGSCAQVVSNLGFLGLETTRVRAIYGPKLIPHLLVEPLIASWDEIVWWQNGWPCNLQWFGQISQRYMFFNCYVPFRGKNTQAEDLCSHLDISKNCPIFALCHLQLSQALVPHCVWWS